MTSADEPREGAMAELHALLDLAMAICGLSVPRGLAWLTALFGSERYSERAMRLLRRPPVDGRGKPRPADISRDHAATRSQSGRPCHLGTDALAENRRGAI
jgi:hypothetical protein